MWLVKYWTIGKATTSSSEDDTPPTGKGGKGGGGDDGPQSPPPACTHSSSRAMQDKRDIDGAPQPADLVESLPLCSKEKEIAWTRLTSVQQVRRSCSADGSVSRGSATTQASGAFHLRDQTRFEVKLENGWNALDQTVCDKILQTMQSGNDEVSFKRGRKNKYVICLRTMTQCNKKTGTIRAIRWQPTKVEKIAGTTWDAQTFRVLRTPSPSPATERELRKRRYDRLRAHVRRQRHNPLWPDPSPEYVNEHHTSQQTHEAISTQESDSEAKSGYSQVPHPSVYETPLNFVSQDSLEKSLSESESDSAENWGPWRAPRSKHFKEPLTSSSQEHLEERFRDLVTESSTAWNAF